MSTDRELLELAMHRIAIRDEGLSATPFRLGRKVGLSGKNIPSPYGGGTRGDVLYQEGVQRGKEKRERDAAEIGKHSAPSDSGREGS